MPSISRCRVEGCKNPAQVRGLCRLDYRRHYDAGTLDQVALPSTQKKRKKVRIVSPRREENGVDAHRARLADEIRRRATALSTLDHLPAHGAPLPVTISLPEALPEEIVRRLRKSGQDAMDQEITRLRAELEQLAFGTETTLADSTVPAPAPRRANSRREATAGHGF